MHDGDERELLRPRSTIDRACANSCPELEAEKLMNGGREAIIIHNGERYRLRITSKQKLILTK